MWLSGSFFLIMKISIDTLNTINKRKLIKEFMIFVELKSAHSNSIIYNDKINKLHLRMGWSRTKAKRAIFIILHHKWAEYTPQGHIRLKTTKDIHAIYSDDNYRHEVKILTKDDFHYELLKQKIQQREFVAQIYCDLKNQRKHIKKHQLKLLRGSNRIKGNELSHRTLVKVFHCSISKINAILKRLMELGKIKIIKQKLFFDNINYNINNIKESLIYNNIFLNKNNQWQVNLSNKIVLVAL